jgi:hypothetical protein
VDRVLYMLQWLHIYVADVCYKCLIVFFLQSVAYCYFQVFVPCVACYFFVFLVFSCFWGSHVAK